jgi:Lactoylglutathione lyase and related lyases
MSIIGIEEIFLAVNNMEKSIEFYNGILGIPIYKQDSERTIYKQKEAILYFKLSIIQEDIMEEGLCILLLP